jgi:predicted flap endonuclease-1-like 5' DNA nuclease
VAVAAPPIRQAVQADDLKRIKGVGPKLEALLKSLGVTRYAQIAAWDDAEIERIDARLGAFQGRIRRDDWPAQARFLAANDMAGFEQRFGRL